jgi:hypothetical protein
VGIYPFLYLLLIGVSLAVEAGSDWVPRYYIQTTVPAPDEKYDAIE